MLFLRLQTQLHNLLAPPESLRPSDGATTALVALKLEKTNRPAFVASVS
jgi:hypothetical protein